MEQRIAYRNFVATISLLALQLLAGWPSAQASEIEKWLIMPGPVIASHAEFEADCSACHAPLSGSGIVSASCILVLLLYPLRKRFRFLKFIGPLPTWFRNHMVLGVSAPIVALYHCNYQLGSLNSRIALFSALVVAGSGLIGRFIYSKIHHGLYGRKAKFKELLAQVKVTTPGVGQLGTLVPELKLRITQFDREVLVPPKSIFESFKLPIRPLPS